MAAPSLASQSTSASKPQIKRKRIRYAGLMGDLSGELGSQFFCLHCLSKLDRGHVVGLFEQVVKWLRLSKPESSQMEMIFSSEWRIWSAAYSNRMSLISWVGDF